MSEQHENETNDMRDWVDESPFTVNTDDGRAFVIASNYPKLEVSCTPSNELITTVTSEEGAESTTEHLRMIVRQTERSGSVRTLTVNYCGIRNGESMRSAVLTKRFYLRPGDTKIFEYLPVDNGVELSNGVNGDH